MRRRFTLQDALNLLEANNEHGRDVEGVFIDAPESAILTDEDSGDEDLEGLIDNLSGKQLLATAEIRFNGNNDNIDAAQKDRVDETVHLREENNNLTESFILRKTAVLQEIKGEYVNELAQKKEFAKKMKKDNNLTPPPPGKVGLREIWWTGMQLFPLLDSPSIRIFLLVSYFGFFYEELYHRERDTPLCFLEELSRPQCYY
ncbi:hypothetical protein J6590_081592 [Homalodisca vitripennis]|nr:hypothetical protein J6590_081592 [Homalodisca vitripennis]